MPIEQSMLRKEFVILVLGKTLEKIVFLFAISINFMFFDKLLVELIYIST